MDDDPEQFEELPGEGYIMDLWIRFTGEVVKLADDLKLSDEDIAKLMARYRPRDSTLACGVTALLQEIEMHRKLRLVTSEIRPGEELVPLSELAARSRKRKDAGEN